MHDNKSFPRIFLALGYPCHPGALDGVLQWYGAHKRRENYCEMPPKKSATKKH